MKIQYEKTFQGAHKLYALVDGILVTEQYFFCSKAEAFRQFREKYKETTK